MLSQKVRHRILIEAFTTTTDPDNGAISEGWATFAADVPAEVNPMSGSEILKADAAQSSARYRFVIRYGPAVLPAMRIVHEGLNFNILDVIPDPSLRRHLTITAEAGLRNG